MGLDPYVFGITTSWRRCIPAGLATLHWPWAALADFTTAQVYLCHNLLQYNRNTMRISWEYSGNIKSTCCIPCFETNAGGRRSNAARKRTTKMLSSSASPTVAAAQNLLPETDWFVQGKYILYVYNCMYTCIYI